MPTYARIVGGLLDEFLEILPVGSIWGTDRWYDVTTPEGVAVWMAEQSWFLVVPTPRPADTDAITYDRMIQLLEGVPTEVWIPRPHTSVEADEHESRGNEMNLQDRVRKAVIKGGTLRVILGADTDAAWDGVAANPSLRSLMRMTQAQINTVGAHRVLNKLLPMVVDMLVTERRIGKLSLDLYDEG